MTFFSNFKEAKFTFDNRTWILEDLTRHVSNRPKLFFNNVTLDNYYIRTGDRPDNVAYSLYDNVNLWWVFFVLNNITVNDWPLDDPELEEYMNATYTKGELSTIVRYENENGDEVPPYGWYTFKVNGVDQFHQFNRGQDLNSTNPSCLFARSNKTPITLRDSLINLNEERRNIKVVKPRRIQQFVRDFEERLASSVFV